MNNVREAVFRGAEILLAGTGYIQGKGCAWCYRTPEDRLFSKWNAGRTLFHARLFFFLIEFGILSVIIAGLL